jgi:hypothetical protein
MTNDDNLRESSKVRYFLFIYFSVYACHSRANLPKEKAVTVCESSLIPNKICEGNSLHFSLRPKGKVKGFPLARNSLLLLGLLLRTINVVVTTTQYLILFLLSPKMEIIPIDSDDDEENDDKALDLLFKREVL